MRGIVDTMPTDEMKRSLAKRLTLACIFIAWSLFLLFEPVANAPSESLTNLKDALQQYPPRITWAKADPAPMMRVTNCEMR